MEVVINSKTFTLLPLNKDRRVKFAYNILLEQSSLLEIEKLVKAIKQYDKLQKNKIKKLFFKKQWEFEKNTLEKFIKQKTEQKEVKDFLNYDKKVKQTLWAFLSPQDKKEIGVVDNIKITNKELGKWQNAVIKEIEEVEKFFAEKKAKKSNQIDTIEAFISKNTGWKREYIKNLSQVDLYKTLEGLYLEQERENIANMNSNFIAGASARGSKEAFKEMKKINNRFKQKTTVYEKEELSQDQKMKRDEILLKEINNQINNG